MDRAAHKKYRQHDPANDLKPLFHPLWFVRYVPLGPERSGLRLHWTLSETRRVGQEWFDRLAESIGRDGLMNPLVVHNLIDPLLFDHPLMVVHGGNRYMALRRLGWKAAPCIVAGTLPVALQKQAVAIPDLKTAQSYIMDGRVINHPGGIRVFDADIAQTGIVTPNPEPYKDVNR